MTLNNPFLAHLLSKLKSQLYNKAGYLYLDRRYIENIYLSDRHTDKTKLNFFKPPKRVKNVRKQFKKV